MPEHAEDPQRRAGLGIGVETVARSNRVLKISHANEAASAATSEAGK